MENFVITKLEGLFTAHDAKGRKTLFTNRRSACFIITKSGKIRFSYAGGSVTSQEGQPVFLPQGCSYTNECLESAESYVFNFQTLYTHEKPVQLAPISNALADEYYQQINAKAFCPALTDRLSNLESLYSLSKHLLKACKSPTSHSPIIEKALIFLHRHYDCVGLTVTDVAQHCCISEIYLRKLFAKELNTSPFRHLTKLRMEKASLLIFEKRPLKEVAEGVGYSDVFQFSRAYKRYFGYPPSKSQ